MLKNHFLIAWRSLLRNSTFYFINISGLAIGMVCSLLISAYLFSELSYDAYPENAENIYRVQIHVTGNGSVVDYASTDWGVGGGMKNAYGEVNSITRFFNGSFFLKYGDVSFKEGYVGMVEPNFLEFFSIPLMSGNPQTALTDPNTIVISRNFAKKYFGSDDPIGKVLEFGNGNQFKVTGLIDAIPNQSHFHFDALASISTFRQYWNSRETWSNVGTYTYLRLNPNTDVKSLETKFRDLVKKFVVPEVQQDMGISRAEAEKSVDTFVFYLQPIKDIHLYSHTSTEMEANGDIKYVYIFSVLAVFILLVACINFINLSTATSAKRSKEIGIRKVMGSEKKQLVSQFLFESLILSGFAMTIAYGIVMLLLPFFNQLTGHAIELSFFFQPTAILIVLSMVVVVGIMAGLYPSLYLSSVKIITVLKGKVQASEGRGDGLRSGLVVFQFAISTALTIATIVIYQQLEFMRNKNLGYNKEQVMVIQDSNMLRKNESVFKEQLLKESSVKIVSTARQVPGEIPNGTQAFAKDKLNNENNAEIHIDIYNVDYNFIPLLDVPLFAGRNFSLDFQSDSSAIVINETAARELGWDPGNAVGNTLVTSGQYEYHVVGVVKDFNYMSVRQKIGPLVMMLRGNRGFTLVKLNASDVSNFIAKASEIWKSYGSDAPFTYKFLDDRFAAQYVAEERTGKVFTTFATIALLIAGLGLFGLSTFTAQQRTKEIGIRKVLGASISQILFMLSKQFLLLVIIGFVVIVPVAVWGMNQWLTDFPYRIDLKWWVFAISGFVSVVIAIFSMSFQAFRAASTNPVESLKSE